MTLQGLWSLVLFNAIFELYVFKLLTFSRADVNSPLLLGWRGREKSRARPDLSSSFYCSHCLLSSLDGALGASSPTQPHRGRKMGWQDTNVISLLCPYAKWPTVILKRAALRKIGIKKPFTSKNKCLSKLQVIWYPYPKQRILFMWFHFLDSPLVFFSPLQVKFNLIFTIVSSHVFCSAHLIFLKNTWSQYFLAHNLKVQSFNKKMYHFLCVCVKAIDYKAPTHASRVTYKVICRGMVGDKLQGMKGLWSGQAICQQVVNAGLSKVDLSFSSHQQQQWCTKPK